MVVTVVVVVWHVTTILLARAKVSTWSTTYVPTFIVNRLSFRWQFSAIMCFHSVPFHPSHFISFVGDFFLLSCSKLQYRRNGKKFLLSKLSHMITHAFSAWMRSGQRSSAAQGKSFGVPIVYEDELVVVCDRRTHVGAIHLTWVNVCVCSHTGFGFAKSENPTSASCLENLISFPWATTHNHCAPIVKWWNERASPY